jgi:small subunit ribosomal protein S25e
LGGAKKKPIAAQDKAQTPQETATKKPEKKAGKERDAQQKAQALVLQRIDDNQVLKVFGGMKAITLYKTARAMNVNTSVANALLKNLESKDMIKRVGGFSGHYVWRLARAG